MTFGRVTLLATLVVVVTLVQATKAGAQSASGRGLAPDTLGGRVGTNLGDDSRSLLHRYDMLAQWMLPWKWHWGRGYELKPFVEATAGLLHNSHESSLIGSISPAVDFTVGTTGVYLTASAGLLLIPNYRLGPEDFGGALQGTFGAGVGFRIGERISLGYRYDHFSDAGLYGSDNRGVDMHMFELRYGLGGH